MRSGSVDDPGHVAQRRDGCQQKKRATGTFIDRNGNARPRDPSAALGWFLPRFVRQRPPFAAERRADRSLDVAMPLEMTPRTLV